MRANPASFFTFGFLIACAVCVFYKYEWKLNVMDWRTFVLVLGANVLFLASTYALRLFYNPNTHMVESKEMRAFTLDDKYLIAILLFQLYFLYSYYRYFSSVAGLYQSVMEASAQMHDGLSEKSMSPGLSRMFFLSKVVTYYFVFILAKMIVFKEYKKKFVYCLLISLCGFITTFFGGAKANSIEMLVYFYVVLVVIKVKANGYSRRRFSLKILLRYAIGIGLTISLFGELNTFLGRDSSYSRDNMTFFGEYCGAQIKNLDIHISKELGTSDVWGQQTFHVEGRYKAPNINQFNKVNGYHLGNVGSILVSIYKDFGMWGIFFIIPFMAIIMYALYSLCMKTRALRSHNYSLTIFVYAYLCKGLLFSFFAERFFVLFTSGFVRMIIYMWVFAYAVDYLSNNRTPWVAPMLKQAP